MTEQALGVIYLPSTPGTAVGEFRFVVDSESGVNVVIGTPVAADTAEGTVIGIVTDLLTYGNDKDPLQADFERSATDYTPIAVRSEVLLATVQVFHADKMRPVRTGRVRAATAAEIRVACGEDKIEWKVPAGVVGLADGTFATVSLDGHNLLGPDAAHLNVGGLSGMSGKTSFASVLLRSAIHAGDADNESVAALLFNVKGQDLVFMDAPPTAGYELSDADRAMYEAMGVPPIPFENVRVFAPVQPLTGHSRSTRTDAEPLRWDICDVWPYLSYLFGDSLGNDNMMALTADLGSLKVYIGGASALNTLDKLTTFLESELDEADEGGRTTCWRDHHSATVRRLLKHLRSLPNRTGGLVIHGKSTKGADVPVADWVHGQVMVVDVDGMEPIAQALVIARTCKRALKAAEDGRLGVAHLVLFADELNMFAPAQGSEMGPVRTELRRVSSTGRYAGMSLWGAAQFLSKVDAQILGNAATTAMGILADSELDSGVYGRMPAGQRERILTLPKGQMALKAYNLRGQLVVNFPRPAWRTGRPKGPARVVPQRPQTTDSLAMAPGSLARLTEGLDQGVTEAVITGARDRAEAVAELDRLRTPDMTRVSVERPATFDVNNPFDLG